MLIRALLLIGIGIIMAFANSGSNISGRGAATPTPMAQPPSDLTGYPLAFIFTQQNAGRLHGLVLGEAPQPLTDGAYCQNNLNLCRDTFPAWSPDGKTIAFTLSQVGAPSQLAVLEVATGQVQILASGLYDYGPVVWAPDGSAILYVTNSSQDPSGKAKIYRFDWLANTSTPLIDTPGYQTLPSYSPDGAYIAFDHVDGGQQEVVLTDGARAWTLAQGGSPAWSPAGDKIAFIRRADGQTHIYTATLDGETIQQITSGDSNNYFPRWSPDGRLLAFLSSTGTNGKPHLFIFNTETGSQRQLSGPLSAVPNPAWSPDGRLIAFIGIYHDIWKSAFVVEVESGQTFQITVTGQADSPIWSPVSQ
jgi:Tol biopolymer transport system component